MKLIATFHQSNYFVSVYQDYLGGCYTSQVSQYRYRGQVIFSDRDPIYLRSFNCREFIQLLKENNYKKTELHYVDPSGALRTTSGALHETI